MIYRLVVFAEYQISSETPCFQPRLHGYWCFLKAGCWFHSVIPVVSIPNLEGFPI